MSRFSSRAGGVASAREGPRDQPREGCGAPRRAGYQLRPAMTVTFVPQFYEDTGFEETERFRCCVARRAGWKITAADRVVSSDRAISLPMLDVPG